MIEVVKVNISDLGYKYIKICTNNYLIQKIKSLNTIAQLSEKISEIPKKNFIYLSLKTKELKKLQASLKKYIKAIIFTIYL